MITLNRQNAKERCRTCLRKLLKNEDNQDNFDNVLEFSKINSVDINTYKELQEMLEKYVAIEGDEEVVSQYQDYPQNICVECLKQLQMFEMFRNKALESAEKLYKVFTDTDAVHKIELADNGLECNDAMREQLNVGKDENDIFHLLLKDSLMETEAIMLDTQETDNDIHKMDPDPFDPTTTAQKSKRNSKKGKQQKKKTNVRTTNIKKTTRMKKLKDITKVEALNPIEEATLPETFTLQTKTEPQADVESDAAFEWQNYDDLNDGDELSDNEALGKKIKHSRTRKIKKPKIEDDGDDGDAEAYEASDSDPDFVLESSEKNGKTKIGNIKKEIDSDVISTDSEFDMKPNIKSEIASKKTKKRHHIMNSGRKKGLANRYKCDQCQHRFGHKLTLDAHIRKVHEGLKRAFQCQLCDKAYSFVGGLSTHIKDVHERQQESYDCHIEGCDKKYSNLITLQRHIRFKHMNYETPNNYVCEQCGATFKQSSNLRYHMRTRHPTDEDLKRKKELPKDRLECEECQKSFHSPYTLKYHKLRVHADEKKFECKICGRRVAKQFMLDSHMLVHSDQKLACKFCGREFVRKYQVEAHIRAVHQKLKPFQCPHCSESFASRKTLRHHVYIHTGEKPYVCNICGQAYRQPTCLKNHRKIHNKLNANEVAALAVNRSFLNNFIQNNEDNLDAESNELCLN